MHAFQQLVGMLTGCLLMLPVIGAVFLQVPAPLTTLDMASPEIETFVREALRDRLVAGDIPDIALMRRAEKKPVLVRAELPGSRMQISSRALPVLDDTELVLITMPEAQQVVTRTGQALHLIAVDHVRVSESNASMWLGVDLLLPPGTLKMCCCERDAQFRKLTAPGRTAWMPTIASKEFARQ